MASIDPGGVGIEMEAGKPNWNDALNGLPIWEEFFNSSQQYALKIMQRNCYRFYIKTKYKCSICGIDAADADT
ncbi:MAG: hypothetical protein HPY74_19745 [Firmicutes bacterium]|nr:hypothetical protein [Bacillota bacterium]